MFEALLEHIARGLDSLGIHNSLLSFQIAFLPAWIRVSSGLDERFGGADDSGCEARAFGGE